MAFVWRIKGLVLLIAAFVTIVTMLVLNRMVLTPIINLGDRLTVTGSDPNNPKKYIIETRRADEWGDVIRAFNRMLQWARSNLDAIKKKENELIIAKEETDKANMAKSEFLATMSHEIRTPMTGVVGMIDLLRETKLDADQKHMMRTVRDSAFTLLKIINDILDTSKIEAGKLTLETLPISLDDIVDGVAETLLPYANDKSVRLVTLVDPALPQRIMADPVRISQILFNLGGNAVKFTENAPDNPGLVVIRADLVDNWRPGQGAVSLKISDSGIGMSKDAIDILFKPFSQAESSTTRRFGGTGLGLSICKSLTDLMEGDIGVESKQGEGSTFTVTLPLVAANEEPVDEDAFDLTGINVLTVFRDSDEGKFAVRYLNHHGASAQAVGGPDEARHIIRSGVPLDVVVIEGDAKKTIEDLRSESEGLCFVILTRDRTVRKGLVDPGIVVL